MWSETPKVDRARKDLLGFLRGKEEDRVQRAKLLEAANSTFEEAKLYYTPLLGYYFEESNSAKKKGWQNITLRAHFRRIWGADMTIHHQQYNKDLQRKKYWENDDFRQKNLDNAKMRRNRKRMHLVYVAKLVRTRDDLVVYYVGKTTTREGLFSIRRKHFQPAHRSLIKDRLETGEYKCFEVKVILCRDAFHQEQTEAFLMVRIQYLLG